MPEREIPPLPQELAVSSLSIEATTTLYAAWLAAVDGADWALQAYQLAAPLANTYPPAASLTNALEKGNVPPSMGYSRFPSPIRY